MSKRNQIDRGRTAADLSPGQQDLAQGLGAGSRDEKAHSAGRPTRVPMSNAKKLDVPEHLLDRENFYYRWLQNKESRISQAEAAGYEHVKDEQGNSYTRQSGPYSMHLMKLPIKYRREDEALKKQRVLATMEEEARIGHNEYAPASDGRAEGGTSAISRTISDH